MGLNFRKSFKIAPGVRLNIGKKGISSISVGGKGARVSLGKKGTRTTVGIPGTGLSHTTFKSHNSKSMPYSNKTSYEQDHIYRSVSFLLGLGIFLCRIYLLGLH